MGPPLAWHQGRQRPAGDRFFRTAILASTLTEVVDLLRAPCTPWGGRGNQRERLSQHDGHAPQGGPRSQRLFEKSP